MRSLYRWAAPVLALLLVGSGLFLGASLEEPGSMTATAAESGAGQQSSLPSFPRDQVIPVAIQMAEADLQDLLDNGQEEQEHHASVTWNGQQLPYIALRAKGNSSLNTVARSDSDRYSLKLYLNEYITGQSLDGVVTVSLNNGFSDSSFMREYLSYEAFASLGVPTPAMTWIELSINGKLWGLYLAVEQIEQPYLLRHFGESQGDLYKPALQVGQGADLKWLGDDYKSYTGVAYKTKGKNADHQPLLQMLDALNNGGDLEQHLDIDGILRYLAVSTALVNLDSYQGNFAHNYYLYEQNGRFTVLPWDLNMSFGGFGVGASGGVASLKIDEPTTGAVTDRPLVAKLLAVPEYRERYHGYIQEMLDGYLNLDRFAERVSQVAAVIDPYVLNDPTKFYTYEQFRRSLDPNQTVAAAATPAGGAKTRQGGPQGGFGGGPGGETVGLVSFVRERVANLQQQLDGTISTRGDGTTPAAAQGREGGMQPPGGMQFPGGNQARGGFQPPGGIQAPGAPARDAETGQEMSALGIPEEQVIPVSGAVVLFLGGLLLVRQLRPRI